MKNPHAKYILLFFCLVISIPSLYSQDLIITSDGDSLNCKITKIRNNFFYFSFRFSDAIKSTLLPSDKVKFFQYNYYQTSAIPAGKVTGNGSYTHFRAGIDGGLGYRIARLSDKIPSDFKDYENALKSGYHWGFDLSYYFSPFMGVGFRYGVFRSKNEIDDVTVTLPDGTNQYGSMRDNITIDFIGPYFATRFQDRSKRNCFLLGLGMGYLGYRDVGLIVTDCSIKGNTLGLSWDMGYDIKLTKYLAIGFQFSYISGILSTYELTYRNTTQTIKPEEKDRESLAHLNLSMGLRLNL